MAYNALNSEIRDSDVVIVTYVGAHSFSAAAEWASALLSGSTVPPKFSVVIDLKRAEASWTPRERTRYITFLNRHVERISRLAFVVDNAFVLRFIQKGIDQAVANRLPLANRMKVFIRSDEAVRWSRRGRLSSLNRRPGVIDVSSV